MSFVSNSGKFKLYIVLIPVHVGLNISGANDWPITMTTHMKVAKCVRFAPLMFNPTWTGYKRFNFSNAYSAQDFIERAIGITHYINSHFSIQLYMYMFSYIFQCHYRPYFLSFGIKFAYNWNFSDICKLPT
jgi:hypothetical protein